MQTWTIFVNFRSQFWMQWMCSFLCLIHKYDGDLLNVATCCYNVHAHQGVSTVIHVIIRWTHVSFSRGTLLHGVSLLVSSLITRFKNNVALCLYRDWAILVDSWSHWTTWSQLRFKMIFFTWQLKSNLFRLKLLLHSVQLITFFFLDFSQSHFTKAYLAELVAPINSFFFLHTAVGYTFWCQNKLLRINSSWSLFLSYEIFLPLPATWCFFSGMKSPCENH